jgi:hypothetical protein
MVETMTKDDYIRLISKASNKFGNKLNAMLDYYDTHGLRDLTLDQVKEYYEKYVKENIK